MTDEQVMKLHCDAYAFLKAAELTGNFLSSETTLGMQGRNSLLTAMSFNLGISLELTLKLLYFRTTQNPYPKGHEYKCLFDKLPTPVQARLEKIYSTSEKRLYFFATWRSQDHKQPSSTPNNVPLCTFRNVLEHFDRLRLFLQRYSSECFRSEQWSEFPYPLDGWTVLLKNMMKCSEEFAETGNACPKQPSIP